MNRLEDKSKPSKLNQKPQENTEKIFDKEPLAEREIHFGEKLITLINQKVKEAVDKAKRDFQDEVEEAKKHFSQASLIEIPFGCIDCKKGDMTQAVYFVSHKDKRTPNTSFICFDCLVKRFQTYAPIDWNGCIKCGDKDKEISVLNKILIDNLEVIKSIHEEKNKEFWNSL